MSGLNLNLALTRLRVFLSLMHTKHAIIDETEQELESIREVERELRHRLINMDVQERKLTRKVN